MTTSTRSEDTRARLLAAARAEFAAYGMSGARVDRIAHEAGVNKQRIYGYFGSKEQLFATVVAEALGGHAADVLPSGRPSGTPEDAVEPVALVRAIHEFHRRNPDVIRLMMWEALHYGDSPVPAEPQRAEGYAELVTALAAASGGGLDHRSAATRLLLAVGMAVLPLALPQMARLVLGPTDDTDPYLVSLSALLSGPERR
ncbi:MULTISPECIES: TetR/AcrR family transcriptional regulator [Streptomycetaceae]|uniref:TetR family regulatory protein n=1 Tax=Streptantibioticus cattleyicolor (strain ATCC 35852 / DSM 46488 / JCM 4925 / NBRC 14057 / NRRL 8057) TaxID=1003195 RepID=F8JUW7_STREN